MTEIISTERKLLNTLEADPSKLSQLTFHLIGIGGIGVSAVAKVLALRGVSLQGSDVRHSQLTDMMSSLGAQITIGHHPNLIDGADVVVYSTAVPKDNVELIEARRRGVPCLHRSQALALCLLGLETVGVTGTHGKGTVSAMISHALMVAERDPTFIIGGILNQYGTNARVGELLPISSQQRSIGVAEVDESDGSHLNLSPDHALVNHLEVDHLNYYDDLSAIIEMMTRFFNENTNLKTAALNIADAGVRAMHQQLTLSEEIQLLTYAADGYYDQELGSLDEVDFSAREITDHGLSISFNAYHRSQLLGEITLPIPGGYNAENAAGALAILIGGLGIDFSVCQQAFNTYEGLENRFTVRRDEEITVVKDYLSHPTGMRRVLKSAQRIQHRKIWCVFKPYRFTLMRYHGEDYAQAFTSADEVVITTMYAANEKSMPGIDTSWFVAQLRRFGNATHFIPDQDDITSFLQARVQAGDLVFFFGGDDFFRMADAWMDQRAMESS